MWPCLQKKVNFNKDGVRYLGGDIQKTAYEYEYLLYAALTRQKW